MNFKCISSVNAWLFFILLLPRETLILSDQISLLADWVVLEEILEKDVEVASYNIDTLFVVAAEVAIDVEKTMQLVKKY